PHHVAAARTELDRLLADDPLDSALWRLTAAAAALDGDAAAAEAAAARAAELRPDRADGTCTGPAACTGHGRDARAAAGPRRQHSGDPRRPGRIRPRARAR